MKTRHSLHVLVSVVFVVGALFLVLLVDGCATTPAPPAATTTSPADTKPYGSLTVQTTFTRGGVIDPHTAGDAGSYTSVGAAIFDSLVELNPEGQPVPGLAERWEIAKDGLSHTFYLRKGVKFHDGSDLTGADVKFSIERLVDPKSINSYSAGWRQALAGVELKDDYTVVLRMRSPQFDLVAGAENFGGVLAVVPKKYIEEKGVEYFTKNPIGTGPWKMLSYQPGIRAELEAFEGHWRAAPKFKNITLLVVDEESSKVAMLKTGELDVAGVTADSVPGLKSAGLRLQGYRGGAQFMFFLFYDVDNPAQYKLGDVRARKALSLAINRQELANKILGGYGQPEAIFHVPPSASFYDPNVLKPDPYDPEGAKKLLVEAGYPNGFSMAIWTGGVLNETVLNEAVAGFWSKVGVKTGLIPKDRSAIQSMWTPKLVPEILDTAVGMVTTSNGFQFEKLTTTYHSKRSGQHNIKNLKLDELIDKVAQMPPSDEKKRLQLEAALMANNENANLPVLLVDTILALGPKVGSFTPIAGISNVAYSLSTITHAK